MKIRIQFKDPDAIHEIICAKHPMPDDDDDITPRMEQDRTEFGREYFEWCDYGVFEIDTETMTGRLVPRKEWK